MKRTKIMEMTVDIKWLPRSNVVKEIGKKETTTIFWIHTDRSRVTQDAE